MTREKEKVTEFKSKDIHLLIKPSTYQAINELAERKETSFNNLVNIVLEMYAKKELKKERELEA